MNSFNYTSVKSLEEASQYLSLDTNNKVIAGGTNIIDLMKYFITDVDELLDINSLQKLKNIETLPNGGVLLGSLVTNTDTAYHEIIEQRYPLLSKAILAGASAQIRNMATNGGNLMQRTRCYYFYDQNLPCNKRQPGSGCSAKTGYNRIHAILGHSDDCIAVFPSDMCVALAALDAIVHVQGKNGKREIQFSEFHRLPEHTPEKDNNLQDDEIITGIELPDEGFAENYSYLKLRDRSSYSFALISVATGFKINHGKIEKARIALGGVAHKPWRNIEAEDVLIGKEPSRENFALAANLILKDAKGFEHNEFKINLAQKAIIRNCIMALDPSSQRPGAKPSL
ncbi:xanthine dehydrogenase family protein subunit M [Chryseobacterium sp.]|uniref:FAD binding domain-containing protein n=1 Tax=Chryseobacterium sp. TaxID=1871047 RepID=UPI0028984ECA|nr:xanthine dehydrogenase family protein subunit M [Chryseobacterium sp.]